MDTTDMALAVPVTTSTTVALVPVAVATALVAAATALAAEAAKQQRGQTAVASWQVMLRVYSTAARSAA